VPYIGNDLQVAFPSYTLIDDISGSFDGVQDTFALTVLGSAPVPFPVNAQQCLISVNGVVQEPDPSGTNGFLLSGTDIVFASPPTGGWSFFGVILAGADYVTAGSLYPDNTAAAPSITFINDTDTGFYRNATNEIGLASAGAAVGAITTSGLRIHSTIGIGASSEYKLWRTGGTNYIDLSSGDLIFRDGTTTRFTFSRTTGNLTVTGNVNVGGSVTDSKGEVRTIPQNAKTSSYILVAADSGKHISITTGGITVPSGIFSAGDAISIYNNSGSSQTITQGSGTTLRLSGTATTGNRTLLQYGLCTVLCVASNVFVVSGSGLT